MHPTLAYLISVSSNQLYARIYFILRFFLFRKRFSQLFVHLPSQGRIVDIGCGYGLTAHLLSLQYPDIHVVGIDMNARRVRTAHDTARKHQRLSFEHADATTYSFRLGDAALCIDVIHHIPYEKHQQFFSRLAHAVGPEGLLVIADVATEPRWKYWVAYLTDVVLYPFSTRCQFYSSEGMHALLAQSGWRVVKEVRTDEGGLFPTVVYSARPSEAAS